MRSRLHMLPVADGSDFMGSLRNPAAWNNVFGMRPSQGRVPSWPSPDVWVSHLSTAGPMGRTVRDVAMLLDVQAGYDVRTPLSLGGDEQFATPVEQLRCRGVRVGWLGDLATICRWSQASSSPASMACIGCRIWAAWSSPPRWLRA